MGKEEAAVATLTEAEKTSILNWARSVAAAHMEQLSVKYRYLFFSKVGRTRRTEVALYVARWNGGPVSCSFTIRT